MLVDLSRNDLSKVCLPSSVEVVQLMDIKRFSHIMHICSTVTGTVDPNLTTFDVFMSAFPAGTLSGAPKPRAIEIIDELEAADRGIYGGTVGYFDLSGNMDMAIAIRTAFLRDHQPACRPRRSRARFGVRHRMAGDAKQGRSQCRGHPDSSAAA